MTNDEALQLQPGDPITIASDPTVPMTVHSVDVVVRYNRPGYAMPSTATARIVERREP